ncbi:MAG: hypothetical protein F6K10_10555 [Moorea sp. SIO2B7]|nr:hypothetical protein [Moorena sp. SIO2B7]
MANIKVNELNPAGTELFLDSESFINDLENNEEISVTGGLQLPCSAVTFLMDVCSVWHTF